jgi:hypothetical protein
MALVLFRSDGIQDEARGTVVSPLRAATHPELREAGAGPDGTAGRRLNLNLVLRSGMPQEAGSVYVRGGAEPLDHTVRQWASEADS